MKKLTSVDSAVSLHSHFASSFSTTSPPHPYPSSSSSSSTSPTSPTFPIVTGAAAAAATSAALARAQQHYKLCFSIKSFFFFSSSPSMHPPTRLVMKSSASNLHDMTLGSAAAVGVASGLTPNDGDPNVLHSLQELHNTLINLVENGMKKEQTWNGYPKRASTTSGHSAAASNLHMNIDSILEEIDDSLNEISVLQTTLPPTPISPRAPVSSQDAFLIPSARPRSNSASAGKGSTAASYERVPENPMLTPTSPVKHTFGTIWARSWLPPHLAPRTSRDDPIRWSSVFILVHGQTIHIFPGQHKPTDLPLQSIRISGDDQTQATHSGRSLFVIRTGAPPSGVRWVFRASSDDEADAWTAILSASVQMAKAQYAVLKVNATVQGSFDPPQEMSPYAMDAPPATFHKRTTSQHDLSHHRRHVVPNPISVDQQHQRAAGVTHINIDPRWNRSLTPASVSDSSPSPYPSPAPNQPLPPHPQYHHLPPFPASFSQKPIHPPIQVHATLDDTDLPPQTPGVFRSRRNSDSDLSRISLSLDRPTPSRKPSFRFNLSSKRDPSIHSDSSSSKRSSFKIQKLLNISSGGAPNSRTHVYLVRGGARQPGGLPSSTNDPATTTTFTHERSLSLGSAETDRASISSDSTNRSTSSSILRVVPSTRPSTTTAAAQVVVLAQFAEFPVEAPKAPPKAEKAKVFMVRGGSQFRAAPNANRLVKITVNANPVVGRALAEEGLPLSPPASPPEGGNGGKKVFLVRTAQKKTVA
ncbi:hypothetical protein BC829DRAFT_431188 [Chytridium lagenaria]|nr:hypothetical protein BC829DRAFT_431188 [Chytridium lagenaria]